MKTAAYIGAHNIHASMNDDGQAVSQRIDYADALRAIAIIMVICIHVVAPLFAASIYSPTWFFANLIDSTSRPAVPLFVMISGMLLLSPQRLISISDFFKRRTVRVIIPFLGWSIIYFLWNGLAYGASLNWHSFLQEFTSGQIYYHLVFIYVILGLYLLFPYFQLFTVSAQSRDVIYILSLWFFGVAVAPLISKFFGFYVNGNLLLFAGFSGYFIAGHYFSNHKPIRFWILGMAVILGVSVTFFGTYVLSKQEGHLDEFFYEYLSANCIITAFAWFLLFKQIPFERIYFQFPWLKKLIQVISSISFSAYLIHPIILETLQLGKLGFSLKADTIHPLFGVPVSLVTILVICWIITVLARRIPLVKWLFQ